MDNRKVARVLIAAGMVLGLSMTAQAQEVLRVGKPVWESAAFAVLEVGMEIGAFSERGISIESQAFGGQGALTQALTGGVVDIALMSGSAMALIPNDAPFSAVAEFASQPLSMVVIVEANSPIDSVDDLQGPTLAVTSTTALTASLARLMSNEMGWGVDGIPVVGLGATEAQWAGVVSGNAAGMVAGIEFAHTLETAGQGRVAVVIGDHVQHFVTHAIFAANPLIDQKPEVVRDFVAGFLEAVAYCQENPEDAARIIAPIIQQSEEASLELLNRQSDMFRADGRFLPEDMEVMIDLFMDQGLFTERLDPASLFTEAFLPN